MEKERYDECVQRQRRTKQVRHACTLCTEDDPAVLKHIDQHHVFGRANSDICIPLCQNCHFKITAKQNQLSPKERVHNPNTLESAAYQIESEAALLEVLAIEKRKQALRLRQWKK